MEEGNRERGWAAAAAALAAAVAAADIATGEDVVFTGLLIVGPLLAAVRAGARATAAVAVWATALAVFVALVLHAPSPGEEAFRVVVVAAGGALAAVVAALRERSRRANERLESILQGLSDGVTVQDPTGRLIYVNEAAARAMGAESVEAALEEGGARALERFELFDEAGEPFPPAELPGRLALMGEEPPPTVVRFRRRDTDRGEERWSMVKARPVRDSRGAVTLAINTMEDVTEQKQAEGEQRFLGEASRLLAVSLDFDTTLQTVAEAAVPEVADWCAVDLLDETGAIVHVALAAADQTKLTLAEELRTRYPADPRAERGVPRVIRTGECEVYEEIPEAVLQETARDEEHLRLIRAVGLRSVIVAPLVARGRTLGAITFVTADSGRRYGPRDVALVEEMGRRAGIAVDNARLFAERSRIARVLQESLLPPRLPELPGMDVAARFLPAGSGNDVGGDFYDLFEMADSDWAVVIGDVCGKGADAAVITALARYTLRTATMREHRPARALAVLNEAILGQQGDGRFCTVALARLETDGLGLHATVATAGHPLPLLLRVDGTVVPVGGSGRLLGVEADADVSEEAVDLAPGDALVLYTDGLSDARAPEEVLSVEQIADVLRGCVDWAAGDIAERLEHAALAGNGQAPRDDIALLVLRARVVG